MSHHPLRSPTFSKPTTLLLATLLIATTAHAQQSPDPGRDPSSTSQNSGKALAPPPPPVRKSDYRVLSGAYGYLYRGSLACGAGAAYSEPERKPAFGCGFGITILPLLVTEFGLITPALNRHNFTAYFSEDLTIPLRMPTSFVKAANGHPVVLGGYTRMFETGRNALDYGVGFEHHSDESHALQIELRDSWTFAEPHQHNVMLRLVWVTGLPD